MESCKLSQLKVKDTSITNMKMKEIKEFTAKEIKDTEDDIEEESSEESSSECPGSYDSECSDSGNSSDEGSRKKKAKVDENEENIIDNQFHDIEIFEKNDSLLDSIISSCDDEDDDYLSNDGESSSDDSQSDSDDDSSEEKSPVKRNKRCRERLYLNLAYTHYPVIKEVGRIFNFKITRKDDSDWDLVWLDGQLPPEKMLRMKSHQKANHYPGMYALSRKNHLGRNLMKMMKQFPNDYRFFPRTWLLPYEMVDFKNNFNNKGKSHKAFIVKPEALCQGEGIFLTKSIKKLNPEEHCIAQDYISKPYLIDDLKFDLRIYVLVYGVDPLRIYLYKEGIVRFATSPYSAPSKRNMNDLFMHLTNYAINKNSDDFIFNEEGMDDVGHKRSLSAVLKQLEDEGNDPNLIMNRISDLIVKTIITCQPSIAHAYKTLQPDNLDNSMIFEILGFDVLLDHKCRPWLLEVNSSPSFATDTPLDRKIKKGLISDTFQLVNLTEDRKRRHKRYQQDSLLTRMRTGKQTKLTLEERETYKKEKEQERVKYEQKNMGKYKLLYPLSEKKKQAFLNKRQEQEQKEKEQQTEIKEPPKRSESRSAKSKRRSSVNKMYAIKKKPVKEEDGGDIYLKYLKKASDIWEDFTTGKKKVKEESSDATQRKIRPKIRPTHMAKTTKDFHKVEKKRIEPKVDTLISSQPAIKTKSKKTVICDGSNNNPKKMVLTTKTKDATIPMSKKNNPPKLTKQTSAKKMTSTTAKSRVGKSTRSKMLIQQMSGRKNSLIPEKIGRLRTKTFIERTKNNFSDLERIRNYRLSIAKRPESKRARFVINEDQSYESQPRATNDFADNSISSSNCNPIPQKMLKGGGFHEKRIIHNALHNHIKPSRKYSSIKDAKYSSKYHYLKSKPSGPPISNVNNNIVSMIKGKGRSLLSNTQNKAKKFRRNRREYKMSNYQLGQFNAAKYSEYT
ncbi:unnamed protein product [Moneuplotes crassus]|uniref:Uncharacterized protein n=1 Tax=Euplotes crassus TaxID=5936 RepID=A0AAD1XVP1_EUPCR|nr:unnamed protein product [Moneuplotes crassus]